jgi:hypothetical protein
MSLTCSEKINDQLADREEDFANAYYYFNQADNCTEGGKIGLDCFFPDLKEYESFFDYINQYGLSWDYVQPEDVTESGYYRYQLTWGGPSDEFRIYIKDCEFNPNDGFDFATMKVFYHFADWFDGALIEVSKTSKAFEACRQLMEVEDMQ